MRMQCAQVNIPSFTKDRAQLSPVDIETTRHIHDIAHVRIHVERVIMVIGLVRNKYTILQDKLPIDYLMSEEGATPVVDKIATVHCQICVNLWFHSGLSTGIILSAGVLYRERHFLMIQNY